MHIQFGCCNLQWKAAWPLGVWTVIYGLKVYAQVVLKSPDAQTWLQCWTKRERNSYKLFRIYRDMQTFKVP
jgi:hypothetical protein